jgi:PIN domain nuclease of toxin-antitoxin system
VLLLDTHVWIWVVDGDARRIGRRARQLIARAERDRDVGISPVSVFEVSALDVTGRLRLARPAEQWIRESLDHPAIRLAELTAAVAVDAGRIPREALADPVDRLLVATARQADATLLTADARILEYAGQTRRVRAQDAER